MIFSSATSPKCRLCLALLCLLVNLAQGARAQDRFSAENFDPAPDRDGSIVAVHGARPLRAGEVGLSLMLSYGRAPLTLESSESDRELGGLVGSVGTLQLLGAVGLARHLDVGVALPLHRMAKGSDFAVSPGPAVEAALLSSSEIGLGDLRLVPRLGLLVPDRDKGAGIAVVVPVWLPTGDDDIYAGESLRVEPRLVFDVRDGGVHGALNVGYMVREEARLLNGSVDDQLRIALGVEFSFQRSPFSALLEVDSQSNLLADDFGPDDVSAEGRLGLRIRGKSGVQLDLGGGPSIIRGIGAPSYRLFAGLSFGRYLPPDRDTDGDGLLDVVDRCPNHAEDADGFRDDDGCPDLDDDGDGLPDASDRCPREPEDRDGFEDGDGCPDLDNDGDGLADARDSCPNEAEDVDNHEDIDGCPDPDNDRDGIPDADDACVDEAGVPEHGGCPPPPPPPEPEPLAVVKEDRIEIRDMIYFALNRATIEERSAGLLDAIAEVLRTHPEILLLRVEGHTDSTGRAKFNKRLSQKRAKAVVDALVARGIAKQRLTAQGFGPDRPIVPNDSDENRALNRRTELHIEKRAEPSPEDELGAPAVLPP